jgi:hypothetical protein
MEKIGMVVRIRDVGVELQLISKKTGVVIVVCLNGMSHGGNHVNERSAFVDEQCGKALS